MSERRTHEYVTKEGRGVIHTRPASDAYREGWERTFRKRKQAESKPKDSENSAIRQG